MFKNVLPKIRVQKLFFKRYSLQAFFKVNFHYTTSENVLLCSFFITDDFK